MAPPHQVLCAPWQLLPAVQGGAGHLGAGLALAAGLNVVLVVGEAETARRRERKRYGAGTRYGTTAAGEGGRRRGGMIKEADEAGDAAELGVVHDVCVKSNKGGG